MSIILNIDTATEKAHVSISRNGIVLADAFNNEQKDHAAFVHAAAKMVFEKSGIQPIDLDAVATTSGPGSYTGLRVGMATAKGFCYALEKPLICINTLELLYKSCLETFLAELKEKSFLFCPMIDARRMEVFTAIFDGLFETILPPTSLILSGDLFSDLLKVNKIIFFGSGTLKWQKICESNNAIFKDVEINSVAMNQLSFEKFARKQFRDVVYSEPEYLKKFNS